MPICYTTFQETNHAKALSKTKCGSTMAGMWGTASRPRSAFSVGFAAVCLACFFTYSAGILTAEDLAEVTEQEWTFFGTAGLPSCNNETFLVRWN